MAQHDPQDLVYLLHALYARREYRRVVDLVIESEDPTGVTVLAREDSCTAGRTDRIGDIAVVKPGTFICDSVEIRSMIDAGTIGEYSFGLYTAMLARLDQTLIC